MPPSSPASPLPRRAVVTGAAAVVTASLSGCSGATVRLPGKTITPPPSPDLAVAGKALHALDDTVRLLEEAGRKYPGLGKRLQALTQAHRHHAATLRHAVDEQPRPRRRRPVTVGATAGAALTQVTTHEQDLATRLEALALEARSGEFARLLASMVASIDQFQTVLAGQAA